MRKREMAALRTLAIVTAIGFSVVLLSMPIVLNLVTFSVATANGVSMTASTAFTTIALFSVMRFPFAFFPFIFSTTAFGSTFRPARAGNQTRSAQ